MVDGVVRWIADPLAELPPSARASLVVLLAFVVAYAALALAVRRLTPVLVEYVLRPAVVVATHIAAVLLLGVQALLALPFRAVQVRPPGVLYGAGDGTVAIAVAVRAGTRELVRPARRLRWIRGRFFVLAIMVMAVWWNQSGCAHDSQSDRCRHPVPAGAQVLWDGAVDLWHRTMSAVVP